MRIAIDKRKCSGCRLCEIVCSVYHFGVANPQKSAIRVRKDDLKTGVNTPSVCLQCVDQKMKCLKGFPESDVSPERARKNFLWSGSCVEHCPYDGIFPYGDAALHCNLCHGEPQCVPFCTPGAISVKA